MRRRPAPLYAAVAAMVISGLIAGCPTASTGSGTLPSPAAAATTTGTATPSAGPSAAPAPTGPVATIAPAPTGAGAGVARVVESTDGGSVTLSAVSCSGPGDCAAVGEYSDRGHHDQGLVMDEKNGTWGSAEPAPGLAALNTGGDADVSLVSCGSVGDGSAIGGYPDSAGHGEEFVVNQVADVWGAATVVRGATSGGANLTALSCAAAGDCVAGGLYQPAPRGLAAFTVDEADGSWRAARAVPGRPGANQLLQSVDAIPCSSASYCGAAGGDGLGAGGAFVLSLRPGPG
jgi:hypothetical protein